VQEGKLFMLQCRGGKRTGAAAVKIAVDMVDEGLVTPDQAVLMVGAHQLAVVTCRLGSLPGSLQGA
jgi:pyruvate, orthophosphate dikinase